MRQWKLPPAVHSLITQTRKQVKLSSAWLCPYIVNSDTTLRLSTTNHAPPSFIGLFHPERHLSGSMLFNPPLQHFNLRQSHGGMCRVKTMNRVVWPSNLFCNFSTLHIAAWFGHVGYEIFYLLSRSGLCLKGIIMITQMSTVCPQSVFGLCFVFFPWTQCSLCVIFLAELCSLI